MHEQVLPSSQGERDRGRGGGVGVVADAPSGSSDADRSLASQYVTYRLGGSVYGIAIELVDEVIRHVQPTPTGPVGDGPCGVINLRGEIVPVHELGQRLGNGPCAGDDASRRIVVVGFDSRRYGIVVDDVEGVCSFEPHVVESITDDEYITAIAKEPDRLVMLVDARRLVRD